jgi:hypothetical protein
MAVLLFFLVVLPMGSYYYLKQGYDYRLAALNELDNDLGKLPGLSLMDIDSHAVVVPELQGNLVVVNFYPAEDKGLQEQLGVYMSKLHDQFDDRNDVQFIMHSPVGADAQALRKYREDYEFEDAGQCHILPTEDREYLEYKHDSLPPMAQPYPYFFLSDTTLTIRNFYDMREENDMKKLVEHIAMILPRIPEKDIVFKRDAEK